MVDLATVFAGCRYYPRPASDHTGDWPYWFVADRRKGDINVTAELIREHVDQTHGGGTLGCQQHMVLLALKANSVDEDQGGGSDA